MALYMEVSVSLSAINGLTRRRAEIPEVIFLQIFSVLGFHEVNYVIPGNIPPEKNLRTHSATNQKPERIVFANCIVILNIFFVNLGLL